MKRVHHSEPWNASALPWERERPARLIAGKGPREFHVALNPGLATGTLALPGASRFIHRPETDYHLNMWRLPI